MYKTIILHIKLDNFKDISYISLFSNKYSCTIIQIQVLKRNFFIIIKFNCKCFKTHKNYLFENAKNVLGGRYGYKNSKWK